MIKEDNNGFVNFPIQGRSIDKLEGLKTFIYLVAFDTLDMINEPYILSNCKLKLRDISNGNIIVNITHIQDDKTFTINEDISQNKLQDMTDRKLIHLNDDLAAVLNMSPTDHVTYFNLHKHISSLFIR